GRAGRRPAETGRLPPLQGARNAGPGRLRRDGGRADASLPELPPRARRGCARGQAVRVSAEPAADRRRQGSAQRRGPCARRAGPGGHLRREPGEAVRGGGAAGVAVVARNRWSCRLCPFARVRTRDDNSIMSPGSQAPLDVTIITGMSGAGRSEAANVLEDLGFFVIDNLPPMLIGKVAELARGHETPSRYALVVDVRSGDFLHDLSAAVDELHRQGVTTRILYLDAADEVLVRR